MSLPCNGVAWGAKGIAGLDTGLFDGDRCGKGSMMTLRCGNVRLTPGPSRTMPSVEKMTSTADSDLWHPPVSIFNCIDHLTVCVKLPGTEADGVQVAVVDQNLIMRGTRRVSESRAPFPIPSPGGSRCLFESVFPLLVPVFPEGVATEYRVGMFWIRIQLNGR